MDFLRKLGRYALVVLAGCTLLGPGCALPPRPPVTFPIGRVAPMDFCPGDRVAATYSLLTYQGDACVSRPGFDCSTIAPPITISSTPAAFPAQTFTSMVGGLTFVPTGSLVAVDFKAPSSPFALMYPTIDRTTGAQTFGFVRYRDSSYYIRRIDGEIHQTLTHTAMCAGANAVYAPGVIATMPTYSPNLRLRRICNSNSVPITITMSAAGGDFSQDLAPSACLSLDAPDLPAGLDAAQVISARPSTVDPMQCGPLQETNPPQTLATSITLACGS